VKNHQVFACFKSMFISATKLAYIFSKSIKDFSPIDLGMYCSSRTGWCHLLYEDSRPQVKGPKKSRFSGPTPSNAPSNDVALLKTIKYKRHKNNWYIGSFMYPSAVVYCCCVLLCVVVC
jgi:hypothetical protein